MTNKAKHFELMTSFLFILNDYYLVIIDRIADYYSVFASCNKS